MSETVTFAGHTVRNGCKLCSAYIYPIGTKVVCPYCNPSEWVGPEPKPRLGDYYAGLSSLEWGMLYSPEKSDDWCAIHSIARQLFRGIVTPALAQHHFVSASDAFAFGALKYGVGTWRELSSDEHMQAAGRHFDAWLKGPQSKDDESGLLHEAHFLARAIMCLEQRRVGK